MVECSRCEFQVPFTVDHVTHGRNICDVCIAELDGLDQTPPNACSACGRSMTQAACEDSMAELDRILCDSCYDEETEDYDGQPDEMQEWHDFDPDC